MATCVTCGANLVAGAAACSGCGEPIAPVVNQTHPASYAKAFELISKAGGSKAFAFFALEPTLTLKEKLYVYGGVNWPLIATGPLWYLYQKMWRRLLVYIPVMVLISVVASAMATNQEDVPVPLVFLWLVCVYRGNVDLYKTKIENNDGWW